MFKECGLIEKYGSGISRIKKLCYEHGIVEPRFQEMQKGFKVTVYKKKSNVGVNVGVNEVYDFIKIEQPIKATIIAQSFTQVTQRTIERYIKQLKDEGKIEFNGSPKSGGYVVR